MTEPTLFDFQPVFDAQLTQGEFARLLDINRVTVNMWFKGHANPHRMMTTRVTKVLALIKRAVDSGQLPLHPDTEHKDRMVRIKTIIAKLLTASR
jgi:DNA-binding XRE family transcriptional regulator